MLIQTVYFFIIPEMQEHFNRFFRKFQKFCEKTPKFIL